MSKHPAYGQSLLKLGLHLSDPIVELGTVWARGDHASARLIHQAILSAEHLRQGRDKMLARVAGSIINKLKTYHSEALRDESRRHKSPYAAHSLTGRRNPRGRGRHRTGKSAGANADRYLARHAKATKARKGRRTLTKRAHQTTSSRHMRMLTKGVNPYARPNENDIPTVIIKRIKRNPNARKMKAASEKRIQAKRAKHSDNFNRAIAFQYTPPLKKRGASRNPAISSKDAASMCRILRNHGYTCTKKGAKRRSKARK